MIKKRLIALSGDSMKHVKRNVLFQWLGLCSNIVLIFSLAYMMERIFFANTLSVAPLIVLAAGMIVIRMFCIYKASQESMYASQDIKKNLRTKIYEKLLRLGPSYTEKVATAEVVQVTVEGVDQLETYFGAYLPQLFYSLLAPLTLFVVLSFFSIRSAIVLLVCVPLIPVSIVVVQKIAKKLLAKYWGQYAKLGDSFLENLQGLTTLKIYQADEYRHQEMNKEAEHFRKVTMKVLTMQLNSIIVMDIVALGGAAVGIIVALNDFHQGRLSFFGMFIILLLAADFFLPMRQLGSYFHIAMNGMAASDKIFALLDFEEPEFRSEQLEEGKVTAFVGNKVSFSYDDTKKALQQVSFEIEEGKVTAFVGKSGCGKSTLAGILSGKLKGYEGSVQIAGKELSDVKESDLMKNIAVVSMNSYLFAGTVRDNLQLVEGVSDEDCYRVLKQVKLDEFLSENEGLDTMLKEGGMNFSGGQRQRLAIARALLLDCPVYIFDEASSNVDVESEEQILKVIYDLAKTKTVLMISHRLAAVKNADMIYAFEEGKLVGSGTHEQLCGTCESYMTMWNRQQQLEHYARGEKDNEEKK